MHAVDRQIGRDYASYKSNQYVDVLGMAGNKPLSIVCGVFGYKEVEKVMDYNDPTITEGVQKDENGAWVIPFKLTRLTKGDASVMYRVSFYKDAVVMLPASETDLTQLKDLLESNPTYTITIHGHANGNHSRRIIALGKTKNYFNINGSDEVEGSAKELSKRRAEAVKSYLADNGIAPDRVKTYAWGGTDMLVDETSTSAKLNDRIEIEIMSN